MKENDGFYEYMHAWGVERSKEMGYTGEIPMMPNPEQYAGLYREFYGCEVPAWHTPAGYNESKHAEHMNA